MYTFTLLRHVIMFSFLEQRLYIYVYLYPVLYNASRHIETDIFVLLLRLYKDI